MVCLWDIFDMPQSQKVRLHYAKMLVKWGNHSVGEIESYTSYIQHFKKANLIVRLTTQGISLYQAYQRLIREYHDLAQKYTIHGHIC